MSRPPARELTERELEVMHVFWQHGEDTALAVRDRLAARGRELAYTTVATLVRILTDKGFLVAVNGQRPFRYRPARPFSEVSRRLLDDLVDRVFHGSRELLLLRLFENQPLGQDERAVLESLLGEVEP